MTQDSAIGLSGGTEPRAADEAHDDEQCNHHSDRHDTLDDVDLQGTDRRLEWWKGCRVGEAKNPGPQNPGQQSQEESQLPDS